MRRIADGDGWGYAPVLQSDSLFPKMLPTRICYCSNDWLGQLVGDRLDAVVSPRRIAVRRRRFGRTTEIKRFKVSDFIGVGVEFRERLMNDGPGEAADGGGLEAVDKTFVSLYLVHEQRSSDLLLYQAGHDLDVIALWQHWSKLLKLPMLSVASDGEIHEPQERIGLVAKGICQQRDPYYYLHERKPIFLRVRDIGSDDNLRQCSGREIMARD